MLGQVLGLAGRALAAAAASGGAPTALAQQAAAAASVSLRSLASRHFSTNSHDIFNVHKDSGDNNWNTEFDFTKVWRVWRGVEKGRGRAVRQAGHGPDVTRPWVQGLLTPMVGA